ncbi:MAG: DNA polymerase III subunit gamma/tau, partial [Patescibacteria group bacterium]|nr:DNA polymerase III subunit gamma/tau [Patescibacteria group bacterium]
MVFYRKYRPQTIAELDSEEIRAKLYSVFSDLSNTPHAFLFTGPKGLGKTSTARIVAKVVNCERRNVILSKAKDLKNRKDSSAKPQNDIQERIEPCNKCDQCVSITKGTNLDILEIDGASNRGIDEIRELREKIKLASISANKKVYIIDEVHMLTTEAFNALLKTLEEPPSHVMFILCTTEPHKVPATIVSRCFHIPFKLATKEELLNSFRRIAKEEKLDIDEDALEYIAGMSDGSFRDGVKVLDEVVSIAKSLKNKKITKELIEEKYKVSSIKYKVSEMIKLLEKKDTKTSIKLISELIKQGVDMKFFIEKLVGELHSMLLIKVGVNSSAAGSSSLSVAELKVLIELFTKAYGELKYAVLPQLPLEIAVIEWGERSNNAISSVADSSSLASELTGEAGSNMHLSRSSKSASSQEITKIHVPNSSSHQNNSFASGQSGIAGNDQNKLNIWNKLIDQVKHENHSLAGVLRGCSLKSFDGKNLEIET